MNSTGFQPLRGELCCDGIALADVARAEGTSLYVYSGATIRERFRAIHEPFGQYPHALHSRPIPPSRC